MSSRKKNKGGSSDSKTQTTQQSAPASVQAVQRHQPPQTSRYTSPGTKNTANSWQARLRRLLKSRVLQIFLILLLVALPSWYFYREGMQAEQAAAKPASANLQTTAEVVKRVSRHILLPSGEQPTVATVSDASKVRSQAFFANAATGDKVLVYAQAKKAYLYRPSIDRIIEVAPLAPNKTSP